MSKRKQPPGDRSPRQREFAFSRVAGVSTGDYAAVDSTAVLAVIVSALGLISVFGWGWWLLASATGLGMALLSLYYIATSADTLVGRKIALAAIIVALGGGAVGGTRRVLEYRQEQGNIARVRELAQTVCDRVRAGDFEAIHSQLSPDFRENMPMGYWRYSWRHFFESNSRLRRIELAPRIFPVPTGEIVANLKLAFDDRPPRNAADAPGERIVTIRLVYAQPEARDLDDETRQMIQAAGSRDDEWQLINLPAFIAQLPPAYREPVIWPAPGFVEQLTTQPDGRLEATGQVWQPGPWPTKDSKGRPVVAAEAQPPLVPPDGVNSVWFYNRYREPWLTQPAPPRESRHSHHH